MNNNAIGIFDSGIGGLTVLDECRKILPFEDFIYLSDSRHAPYGNKSEEQILERAKACVLALVEQGVKAIVTACNTVTSVGISSLRECYNLPFIGLEPALKPASEMRGEGSIVLLCTQATSKQQKFKELILKYGDKNLVVLPQKNLAQQVETNKKNLSVLRPVIKEILEPYKNVKAIVLGCTHYVFLRELIQEYCGQSVKIFDGNRGASIQLKKELKANNLLTTSTSFGGVIFINL